MVLNFFKESLVLFSHKFLKIVLVLQIGFPTLRKTICLSNFWKENLANFDKFDNSWFLKVVLYLSAIKVQIFELQKIEKILFVKIKILKNS